MAGYLSRKEHIGSSSSSAKLLIIEDADRLSSFPQEIRNEILTYLTTTDAARMGLLSKIWRRTWHSMSKLVFDYRQFPEMENKLDAFIDFVDQTLASHDNTNVKIFELRLLHSNDGDIPINPEWITFAIQHYVEKLVLYGKIEIRKLPDCLFSCQSLVKLELALDKLVLTWPKTFSLPNLRKIKFKYLLLSELLLSQDLFSSFPALEKLSIFSCNFVYFNFLSISSSKLTELILCSCPGLFACSIRLQTPCLSKFIYISPVARKWELNIPSDAFQFVINGGDAYMKSKSTHEFSRSVIKVTRELFKKSHLMLHDWFIEYLSMAHDLPRQLAVNLFHNLLMLTISLWPVMEHVKVLMLLISRCPNLSALSLEFVASRREARRLLNVDYSLNYDIGEGNLRSLSHITIENFGGNETEMLLVRCFLANTPQLLLLRIVVNIFLPNNDVDDFMMSKIHGFEKASPFADIIFH